MRKKIVFIAHSYHKKTRSYAFVVDYLKTFYDVELLFDEFWDTGKEIDWAKLNDDYKAIVIFQMIPKPHDFKKITNKNIVYFPMYDYVAKWTFEMWYYCKDVKIISFSSTLHKKLKRWGFNSTYIQYFIEPKEFSPGSVEEIFFWQRLTKINIKTIISIFKKLNVKIHIHKCIDPGQEFIQPTKEEEKQFNIEYSTWFDTKKEMVDLVRTKGIYIAPRFSEGIGMSFLEAMAQGKIVVANNKPTMNEYIEHGKTGFLCNFKFPRAIKLSNVEQIQRNTYEYAKAGYEKWISKRKIIIELIEKTPEKNELKLWTKLFKPFLFFNVRKIIKVKFGSNPSLLLFGIKIV